MTSLTTTVHRVWLVAMRNVSSVPVPFQTQSLTPRLTAARFRVEAKLADHHVPCVGLPVCEPLAGKLTVINAVN